MKENTALVEVPSAEPEADESKPGHVDGLRALRMQALSLVEHLQVLASGTPELTQYISVLQELTNFENGTDSSARLAGRQLNERQLQEFGKLLRDKRNKAGFSRVQLARKAKISDATIKFIETAKHPPSRATLIRLISVDELNLTWADVPGQPVPPAADRVAAAVEPVCLVHLNCFVTPSCEPVREVTTLGRVLNGAGGHVEQTSAYLDLQSVAAYVALCQQSANIAGLRARTPLAEAARRIVANSGAVNLQVIALGPGDGTLEVRLVQHLAEAAHAPLIDLCLLDISQPMLSCAFKQAADLLAERSDIHVWGMQCNFYDLPLYSDLFSTQGLPKRQRIFCLLGETLADLDNEPRFFQHSLQGCERGDMLLLDMQVSRASNSNPEEIKKRDKAWSRGLSEGHAAWLSGPIWRHCTDVVSVGFHWKLETHCPVPGSYALNAVATVQSRDRDDRQFSMFRFRRYTPSKLSECLSSLGWDEILDLPYGNDEPAALRLFCKRTHTG